MIITDRATRVGCAIAQYTYNADNVPSLIGQQATVFACDYSSINMEDSPVFRIGPTAAECQTKNPEYPALCGPNDPIDPNDYPS